MRLFGRSQGKIWGVKVKIKVKIEAKIKVKMKVKKFSPFILKLTVLLLKCKERLEIFLEFFLFFLIIKKYKFFYKKLKMRIEVKS